MDLSIRFAHLNSFQYLKQLFLSININVVNSVNINVVKF